MASPSLFGSGPIALGLVLALWTSPQRVTVSKVRAGKGRRAPQEKTTPRYGARRAKIRYGRYETGPIGKVQL